MADRYSQPRSGQETGETCPPGKIGVSRPAPLRGTMASRVALMALWAAALLPGAHGFHFYLNKEVPRCFIEDVPRETLVMGSYVAPREAAEVVVAVVTAPGENDRRHDIQGNEVMVHKVNGGEGKFVFTAHDDGEHLICLYINTTDPRYQGQNFRFELRFDTGEHATNYDDLAKSEHFSAIELEVRKLIDTVRDIRRQQSYLRAREATFRDTSEATNSSVVWWSVIQTIVLVISGYWQVHQLKAIFKVRKWD